MLEIGILGKVDEIPDEGMKFYALIGLCVSTAATIEHTLFDCFHATCGMSRRPAAREFYRKVQFDHKRDLADGAVRAALAGTPAGRTWDEIISQIQTGLGPDGARNLISHNGLAANIYFRKRGDDPQGMDQNHDVLIEMAVTQNQNIVLAGKRRPAKQTLNSLKSYAYDLLWAELRLHEFYRTHLATRLQHRQAGAPARAKTSHRDRTTP